MSRFSKLSLCVAVLLASPILAEENHVVRIEEQWEMQVRDPDPVSVSPQVTNAFAPNCACHETGFYASFSLNHQLLDEGGDNFIPGGLQLQLWNGETLLARKSSDKRKILSTANEKISWKQVLQVSESGVLTASIKDGQSQTWGNFGNSLSLSVHGALHCLNDYKAEDSVKNSGAVFAENRIAYRILKRVVATYESGAVKTIYTHGSSNN